MQFDKYVALDILNRVHISIEHIEERSQPYHCGDDFLMSSTGEAILDPICMQFIAIGESLKGLDKVTKGELLTTHPEIDWKNVKGLRDIIAQHYFEVDADQIWWIIENELQFIPGIKISEDTGFMIGLLCLTKAYFVPEVVSYYIRREKSATTDPWEPLAWKGQIVIYERWIYNLSATVPTQPNENDT